MKAPKKTNQKSQKYQINRKRLQQKQDKIKHNELHRKDPLLQKQAWSQRHSIKAEYKVSSENLSKYDGYKNDFYTKQGRQQYHYDLDRKGKVYSKFNKQRGIFNKNFNNNKFSRWGNENKYSRARTPQLISHAHTLHFQNRPRDARGKNRFNRVNKNMFFQKPFKGQYQAKHWNKKDGNYSYLARNINVKNLYNQPKFRNFKFPFVNKFKKYNIRSKLGKGRPYINIRRPLLLGNRFATNNYYRQKRPYRKFKKFLSNKPESAVARNNRIFGRWHTNKKPFWKRRSYRYIKFCNQWEAGTFRTYLRSIQTKIEQSQLGLRPDKLLLPTKSLKRKKEIKEYIQPKLKWSEYCRRNKIKLWFRNKIALRFLWMTRYGGINHHQTAQVVKRIRNKNNALFMFWKKVEFTLDRYVIWWQLMYTSTPWCTNNELELAKWIIRSGFIYVNFLPMTNEKYCVQRGDCIFFVKYNGTAARTFLHFSSRNYWGSKFRPSFRYKMLRDVQRRNTERDNIKFIKFLKKYQLMKTGLTNQWSRHYFLYYMYFVERSYKYKIFVNLHEVTWHTLLFSTFTKLSFPITYRLLNLFVNRRYG